jgi:hypothetical protein
MSLRTVVAAPFLGRGRRRLDESEFVVALSLDRDWFSPDQASRVVDIGVDAGLLRREDEGLVPAFETDDVSIPADFRPEESILAERPPFELALAALIDAGVDKRAAVAGINRLQADLGVTVEAAAVVFARRHGVDVAAIGAAARAKLLEG